MEIITSHGNADLDALASMVAAHKLYPHALMILPHKLSRSVEEVISLHKDAFPIRSLKDIKKSEINRLILVDTKDPRRLGRFLDNISLPEVDVHIYDHHPWSQGDIHGSLEVVETVGAAVTLLIEKIQEANISVSSLEATILALGIYADTGSLVYPSTTSRDVEAVAFLLKRGANLSVVSEFLDRPLTEEQKSLLKMLLLSAKRYQINGVKILITRGEVEEYIVGLAMLTHIISDIEKLDAIFTVVKMEDRVHLVARGNIPQVNVAEIIHSFKGGGHGAASSATIKNLSIDEVIKELLINIEKYVRPPLAAIDIMSSPVKTVHKDMSMAEVGHVMLRYGHSGLPVVEGEKLVGIISRRDVEKAMHHGLSHAPAKGFMTVKVITIVPNMPVSQVRELMITHDIGRVPVVENGALIGLVSRTDVLRTLHGDYHNPYQRVYEQDGFERDNIGSVLKQGLSRVSLGIIAKASSLASEMGYQLYVAGGVVRDILLGYDNTDLDLVVEGDGIILAKKLASQLNCKIRPHQRFRTAELSLPGGNKVDIATARVEFYEYPAALPQVEVSSLHQDLYRRDFTINAMAVALNADRFGELVDYFGGKRDLQDGLVRVLYNLSFIEDPTRMLRAIRFEKRYQIKIESRTLELLQEAVNQEVMKSVSGDRIRYELYHIFDEERAGKMLERLNDLGLWPQVFPNVDYSKLSSLLLDLEWNCKILEQWGIEVSKEPPVIYWIAILSFSPLEVIKDLAEYYYIGNRIKEKILLVVNYGEDLLLELQNEIGHSKIKLAEKLLKLPTEAYPWVLALLKENKAREQFKNILLSLKDIKMCFKGRDLKKMGYRPGPLYKEALDELWRACLNGEVKSEEEEEAFITQFFEARGVKPDV